MRAHDGIPLTGDMLDSVFYFPQYYTVDRRRLPATSGATQPIQDLWNQRADDWGTSPAGRHRRRRPTRCSVNFLDNHDVGALPLLRVLRHRPRRPRQAADAAQFDAIRASSSRTRSSSCSPSRACPASTTATSRASRAATTRPTAKTCGRRGYATTGRRPVRQGVRRYFAWIQKLTKLRSPTRRSRTAIRRWSGRPRAPAGEADAGIFAFERAGGDAAQRVRARRAQHQPRRTRARPSTTARR